MNILPTSNNFKPQPFDAMLVHGYWYSQRGHEGIVKLGLRGKLAARAASLVYDNGNGVKQIVLTEGRMWGDDYPSGAALMKDRLEKKYRVPSNAIIIRDRAYSTGGEIETFLTMAHENKWSNLLGIAAKTHLWTIPKIYKSYGESVQLQSVEEIIYKRDSDPRLKKVVQKLGKSKYELNFKLYETLVWLMIRKGKVDYTKLEERNRQKRTKKGKDFILPLDVYNT